MTLESGRPGGRGQSGGCKRRLRFRKLKAFSDSLTRFRGRFQARSEEGENERSSPGIGAAPPVQTPTGLGHRLSALSKSMTSLSSIGATSTTKPVVGTEADTETEKDSGSGAGRTNRYRKNVQKAVRGRLSSLSRSLGNLTESNPSLQESHTRNEEDPAGATATANGPTGGLQWLSRSLSNLVGLGGELSHEKLAGFDNICYVGFEETRRDTANGFDNVCYGSLDEDEDHEGLPSPRCERANGQASHSTHPGESPGYRVVVMGAENVGKTELVHQFMGMGRLAYGNPAADVDDDDSSFEDPYADPDQMEEHHFGTVHERELKVGGEKTKLWILDMSAKDLREDLDHSYLEVGNAFVVVYSCTDKASFDEALNTCATLRQRRRACGTPVILVANKSDLVRCRQVCPKEAVSCALVLDCKFIETSAMYDLNVDLLFEGVVRQLRLRGRGISADKLPAVPTCTGDSHGRYKKKLQNFVDQFLPVQDRMAKLKAKSCGDLSVL
ncbi:GTP-binding protein RAD-like [Branchiostoma lanceolatum]|uniref:GTP-binding protein RAD-like n=1 Tax=Branchiostoma lanceolatum TaxID=7740 RepID=UPI0034528D29